MNRRKFLSASLMMIVFFASTNCALKTAPLKESPSPSLEKPASIVIVKEAWEDEWNRVISLSRKESKVVIYSTLPSTLMREAMTKAMGDKYGIQLDMLVGRGAEIAAKIFSERNAKIFLTDIYLGGTSTPLNDLKPAGALEPLEPALILPEVTDLRYWVGGKLGWVDKSHYILGYFGTPAVSIAINTNLVRPGEEPRTWKDLLDLKWKGKIIMNDPTTTGTAASSFSVLGWHLLDLDFFYQLAKQAPVVMRDRRLMHDWLAHGKYSILIFPYAEIVKEFRAVGAPLALLTLPEGTYLSSGGAAIALLKQAPHPGASKVFVNWLLSREGQTLVANAAGLQSLRIDVKTEGLDPAEIRREGVKYFLDKDTEEFLSKIPERIKIAEEIFSPFVIK